MTTNPSTLGIRATFACFVMIAAIPVLATTGQETSIPPSAAEARHEARLAKKKHKKGVAGSRVSGAPPYVDRGTPVVDYTSTISEFTNKLGQTVYSISDYHHDISPALSELQAQANRDTLARAPAPSSAPTGDNDRYDLPPRFTHFPNGVPDAVAQQQMPPPGVAISPNAPTTVSSFIGIGVGGTGAAGGTPPDTNGSVGNNQYVQSVNTNYAIWNITRPTNTGAIALAGTNINVLWNGFGGACQTQNSGDPIVLYDKLADRWMIAQFTSQVDASNKFYECVAVSTTPNATGTYARYGFSFPVGLFGDYPHLGVWPDGYYMMAHLFDQAATPNYIAGAFAAMDRVKMLTGAAATMQLIQDPLAGGHLPADLDGFAPPPVGAPGIFVQPNDTSNSIYRMKVDWVTPANTTNTLQASVTHAAVTTACAAAVRGACIPQPGTTAVLEALSGRLMFRVAYRNNIDHETLLVNETVDPGITGVVAGVRWFDIRLSGTGPACATYPCTYQEGTVADVANGRNRWVGSIASDTAENVLLGYSTSGKAANSENHSIRYTGRAKGDPLNTMTGPEVSVINGTKNEIGAQRWGDYSSMSIDPFDDCTFWFTTEYYTSQGASTWSTRIASAKFPAGAAAGQCPATTCTARPATAPTIGAATTPGNNQIAINWTGIAPTPGAYQIVRSQGTCAAPGYYAPLATVPGATTTYTDNTVQGGLTYSYRVVAAADAAAKCQSLSYSGCVQATATGNCTIKPTFTGAASASSNNNATCGVNITWPAATSNCPLTPTIKYNVFRGTAPDFIPAVANRIATCATGPTSYLDTAALTSGNTYYYVVRAEDSSTVNGGECGGGNEESNSAVVPGTPYGVGLQAGTGTWTDDAGDTKSFLQANVASGGPAEPYKNNTAGKVWRYLKTTTDAGANHTTGGAFGYRNAGPSATDLYSSNECTEVRSPALTVGAASVALSYWARYNSEWQWDGVFVEYSRNGGIWTTAPAPVPNTDWGPLTQTTAPPVNACGYPAAAPSGYTGPNPNPAASTAYALRTHTIAGLANNDTILFRWRSSSDPAATFTGFYLDDIAVTNIHLPNVCTTGGICSVPSGFANNTAADASACAASGNKVNWTAPTAWGDTSGTRTYDVLRNGTPLAAGTGLSSATLTFTDATAVVGTTYTYTVRANNGCGSSTTTAGASATDLAGSAPSGFANNTAADANACLATGNSVNWAAPTGWNDNAFGTRTYDVLRNGTPLAAGTGLSAATLTFTDATAVASTAYTYTVRANNGCALNTVTTPGASATDLSDVTAPTMTKLSAAKASPNINFSWPSAEAGATYTTYTSPTPNPVWTSANSTATLAWSDPTDLGTASNVFFSTTAKDGCLNESPK